MYDVLVIGGGPGGYTAAIRASQLGGRVALVECGDIGGTCVNRGCIPTKIWQRAAYLAHCMQRGNEFGLEVYLKSPDVSAIVARKKGIANDIRMGMEALLTNNGVELVRGRAIFKSAREIDVEGHLLTGKKIILSTGSTLAYSDVSTIDDALLTTDQLLDLEKLPSSILICGGGPVEVEIAQFMSVFGSRVTLITDQSRILDREDHDTSQRISQALKEHGVDISTKSSIAGIKKSGDRFEVLLNDHPDQNLLIDKVLVSSRMPNTKDLELETVGVRLNDDGSIWVDQKLQTSMPGLYAVGDVTGGWMQSHVSSAMAVTAAANSMGQDNSFPYHLIPRGVWTFPQVGSVGMTEQAAENAGHDVEVGDFPMSINGLGMATGEVEGAVKIITDSEYGEVLGVHIVGAHATELIGEAVLALQLECTADELAHTIRLHPTFSETLMDAGRDARNWALYLPKQ